MITCGRRNPDDIAYHDWPDDNSRRRTHADGIPCPLSHSARYPNHEGVTITQRPLSARPSNDRVLARLSSPTFTLYLVSVIPKFDSRDHITWGADWGQLQGSVRPSTARRSIHSPSTYLPTCSPTYPPIYLHTHARTHTYIHTYIWREKKPTRCNN